MYYDWMLTSLPPYTLILTYTINTFDNFSTLYSITFWHFFRPILLIFGYILSLGFDGFSTLYSYTGLYAYYGHWSRHYEPLMKPDIPNEVCDTSEQFWYTVTPVRPHIPLIRRDSLMIVTWYIPVEVWYTSHNVSYFNGKASYTSNEALWIHSRLGGPMKSIWVMIIPFEVWWISQ